MKDKIIIKYNIIMNIKIIKKQKINNIINNKKCITRRILCIYRREKLNDYIIHKLKNIEK